MMLKVFVGGLIFWYVTLSALDQVVFVRFNKQQGVYVFPIMQLMYPTSFAVLAWLAIGVCVLAHRFGWSTYHPLENAPPLRELAPKAAVVAILDGLSGFLALVPVIYLRSELLIVLGQVSLPVILTMSALYLGRRYYVSHYLGAATVVAGVCVAVVPTLTGMGHTTTPGLEAGHLFVLLAVFVASTIPATFSKVYEERWLKRYHLDPLYFLALVALFQSVFAVLLLPALLIPLPSPAPQLTPEHFGQFIQEAFLCFGAGVTPSGTAVAAANASDEVICDGLWQLFMVFIGVNVLMNGVFLTLIKTTTANLGVVISVLRLGVSSLLFEWRWLAGVASVTPTAFDVLSLVVVILGVLMFGSRAEIKDATREQDPHVLSDIHAQELGLITLEDSSSEAGLSLDA